MSSRIEELAEKIADEHDCDCYPTDILMDMARAVLEECRKMAMGGAEVPQWVPLAAIKALFAEVEK